MYASVASKPTRSPDETPTAQGEAALISLTLQGGGARGAFTWGVCDSLLEDKRIRFSGIGATRRRRHESDSLMSTRRIR